MKNDSLMACRGSGGKIDFGQNQDVLLPFARMMKPFLSLQTDVFLAVIFCMAFCGRKTDSAAGVPPQAVAPGRPGITFGDRFHEKEEISGDEPVGNFSVDAFGFANEVHFHSTQLEKQLAENDGRMTLFGLIAPVMVARVP